MQNTMRNLWPRAQADVARSAAPLSSARVPRMAQSEGVEFPMLQDGARSWRIVYHVDAAAIVILEMFSKTTTKIPQAIIDVCKARLRLYRSV
jgi:phage-related protein